MPEARLPVISILLPVGAYGVPGQATVPPCETESINSILRPLCVPSWGNFPSPSAVHILGRAIADISRLQVPKDPKTTFNVGVIHGGTTVNTIAAEAEMLVDMRSVDARALAALERQVLAIVERAAREGQGQVKTELVGDRPAGAIPADHPVVRTCRAIHQALGLQTYTEAGSTDHNVPLAMGVPGVCLSVTEGANEHRLDEYIETGPVPTGVKNILLDAVALTRVTSPPG